MRLALSQISVPHSHGALSGVIMPSLNSALENALQSNFDFKLS